MKLNIVALALASIIHPTTAQLGNLNPNQAVAAGQAAQDVVSQQTGNPPPAPNVQIPAQVPAQVPTNPTDAQTQVQQNAQNVQNQVPTAVPANVASNVQNGQTPPAVSDVPRNQAQEPRQGANTSPPPQGNSNSTNGSNASEQTPPPQPQENGNGNGGGAGAGAGGQVSTNAGGFQFRGRFDVEVRGKPRGVEREESNSDRKEFDIRPTNNTLNFKTKVGFRLRPAPTLRTMIFNKTEDSDEAFGYRVNVLRLAEVEGTTNALNSTNVVNLTNGGGAWSFRNIADRTVNGTTIKTMQARFLADINVSAPANPRAEVFLTADFPLADVTEGTRRRRPNSLKWSLNITNFPYTSDNSKLALLLGVNSRSNVTVNTTGTAVTAVTIGSGKGSFTWDSTIYVANVAKSLTVTNLGVQTQLEQSNDDFKMRNERATYLQFTVDQTGRPGDIYWDPENDVNEDAALGNTGGAGMLRVSVMVVWVVGVMVMVL